MEATIFSDGPSIKSMISLFLISLLSNICLNKYAAHGNLVTSPSPVPLPNYHDCMIWQILFIQIQLYFNLGSLLSSRRCGYRKASALKIAESWKVFVVRLRDTGTKERKNMHFSSELSEYQELVLWWMVVVVVRWWSLSVEPALVSRVLAVSSRAVALVSKI